ncbi:peroxiredoxin-like family protein [Aureispira sp. CCB-QB1]|uniref:peroxiredoxin-like family protein n=1 Tax=Aureispira sp. CCB-QB1 TaxID=1313421 RepID=UPI0006986C98|nr:peroxiredoxin-like family protein [Aureispira sp. CCB-QB1]
MKKLLQATLIITSIIALCSFTTPTKIANTTPDKHVFLQEGSKAPNFVTKDVLGNQIKLNKVLKDKNVLITFLRPAWCPICNARTHELINSYQEMKEKGIEVIAIYPSSEEELQGYVKDMNIPFTVIADPDEELYKLYGVERSVAKYKRTLKEKKALEAMKKGQDLYKENDNNYGGLREVQAPIIPADFVISQAKVIETAHYGDFIGDHIPVNDIEENLTYDFNLLEDNIRF